MLTTTPKEIKIGKKKKRLIAHISLSNYSFLIV